MTNTTHLTENYTASRGRVLWYSHLKFCNTENTICQQCTYQKINALPSISYSSDCNKNEMMHTVTGRSKIKVWADDAMKVESRYLLGHITKHSCAINPFTVHARMGNTVYVWFSIQILCIHKVNTSKQPI